MALSLNKIVDWWQNAGVTYQALRILVTDTASAADSKIIYAEVDGTEVFHVDKDGVVKLPSFVMASLPSAATVGRVIYISNEVGGATLAFSDGTNWRRVADLAVVSAV